MAKRVEEAVRMRDMAWALMRAEGQFQDLGGMGPHLVWNGDEIQMILRTPFRKLSQVPEHSVEAAPIPESAKNLPYGLDIWDWRGKVLNIEWNGGGEVRLAGFRRGDWQHHLTELCRKP